MVYTQRLLLALYSGITPARLREPVHISHHQYPQFPSLRPLSIRVPLARTAWPGPGGQRDSLGGRAFILFNPPTFYRVPDLSPAVTLECKGKENVGAACAVRSKNKLVKEQANRVAENMLQDPGLHPCVCVGGGTGHTPQKAFSLLLRRENSWTRTSCSWSVGEGRALNLGPHLAGLGVCVWRPRHANTCFRGAGELHIQTRSTPLSSRSPC